MTTRSRFIAPNLAALGDLPTVVPISHDLIRTERSAALVAALERVGITYDVDMLRTDPLVIGYSEGGGYREALWRGAINDALRATSLATAVGGDLDHRAATLAGIERLVYSTDPAQQPAESQWDLRRGAWVETDASFRDRTRLAFEAFSVAGPEGAYVFQALELDGVRDVADAVAYSEEDGATYTAGLNADAFTAGRRPMPFAGRGTGAAVLAPEILIVVLPTVTYGVCDQPLLDRVWAGASGDIVRPCGDTARIEPATVTPYAIEVQLSYGPGADPDTLQAEAERRLALYAAARRRIGLSIQPKVIGGRAAIDDGVTVDVLSPSAEILPGPKGAAECTGITVTPVRGEGSWS